MLTSTSPLIPIDPSQSQPALLPLLWQQPPPQVCVVARKAAGRVGPALHRALPRHHLSWWNRNGEETGEAPSECTSSLSVVGAERESVGWFDVIQWGEGRVVGWGDGGAGVSEPGSEHTCTCASVWVWVNPVPGFTAAQGHHLQPRHRSAGDGFIPNQQKVSVSGDVGRPPQSESVRLCRRPTSPFLNRRPASFLFLFPPCKLDSSTPAKFCVTAVGSWSGDINCCHIHPSASNFFCETATVAVSFTVFCRIKVLKFLRSWKRSSRLSTKGKKIHFVPLYCSLTIGSSDIFKCHYLKMCPDHGVKDPPPAQVWKPSPTG